MVLRDEIGIQIDPDKMEELCSAIGELLASGGKYAARIEEIRDKYIANFGNSAQIGGQYIIDKLTDKGN